MIYYGSNDYRNYLAHYGVVGMHWGIRRYQPYDVKPRGSGKGGKFVGGSGKGGSGSDYGSKEAKKKPRDMSDDELNKHVNRLQKEKQARDLEEELYHPVRNALKKLGKTAVNIAVSTYVAKKVGDILKNKVASGSPSKHQAKLSKLSGSSTIDDMRAKEAMRHTKEVTKQAKKDAAEYAKARVRTGEGAGNRRKLINMQIQERSKDPEYKKAFDEYSKKQNYVKLSDQERRRSTAVKTSEALKRGAKKAVAVTATAATVAFYLNQMGMLEPIIDKIKR